MMNYIWGILILISIICSIITGKVQELSNAVLSGASDAVKLIISILGMMALWTGIMKIAEKSGITDFLAKLFSPIIKFIFPDCSPGGNAAKAICMNITANLLGLGNAATPFGIKAMKELKNQELKKYKNTSKIKTATNSMAMFVVINTASLQLIPTLLCTLRQNHNSQNPMGIIILLWITSFTALTAGVLSAKVFERISNKNNE